MNVIELNEDKTLSQFYVSKDRTKRKNKNEDNQIDTLQRIDEAEVNQQDHIWESDHDSMSHHNTKSEEVFAKHTEESKKTNEFSFHQVHWFLFIKHHVFFKMIITKILFHFSEGSI